MPSYTTTTSIIYICYQTYDNMYVLYVYHACIPCYNLFMIERTFSHQQWSRPFVSITLHFPSVLIQTHGSQLCLIAGKLHGARMAVTVYILGKAH